VADRWRKALCGKDEDDRTVIDKDKMQARLAEAYDLCVAICEQQKTGTTRGTEGTGDNDWNTPEEYIELVREVFGGRIDRRLMASDVTPGIAP
jgi:hypothetical protein